MRKGLVLASGPDTHAMFLDFNDSNASEWPLVLDVFDLKTHMGPVVLVEGYQINIRYTVEIALMLNELLTRGYISIHVATFAEFEYE